MAQPPKARQWLPTSRNAIRGSTELHGLTLAECPAADSGRDFGDTPETVQVTLAFSIHDREALWEAAAKKGLAAPGMRLADVIDVIGPREDPALAECVAMLAPPASMAGCTLDRFDIEV